MNYLDKNIEEELFTRVESLGYELMDLEFNPQKNGLKITVFIDHDNGIDIDDCVNATKKISPIFENDESEKNYIIEVSSPGLDRKLINKEHFDRFIGKSIKIKLKTKLKDRKNFKGQLLNRIKDTITIQDHDNREIKIDLKLIDVCRIVPVFK
ncbi:MAG: ribosome maturation factor RimP [Gammaproteobacteria bacterium]|nr:ribosome maturation factor RimP [Gammaproteobacteria bacterium]